MKPSEATSITIPPILFYYTDSLEHFHILFSVHAEFIDAMGKTTSITAFIIMMPSEQPLTTEGEKLDSLPLMIKIIMSLPAWVSLT